MGTYKTFLQGNAIGMETNTGLHQHEATQENVGIRLNTNPELFRTGDPNPGVTKTTWAL
jgi:hypothetical protein